MESRLNKKYYNLTEPQKIIFVGELMNPNTSLNTISISMKVVEDSDPVIMKKAIESVILVNPGLHLRMTIKEGIPYQYMECNLNYNVDIIDFRHPEGDKEEKQWVDRQVNSVFKLENGILFNIVLFYSFDNSLHFMLQTHHLISDGSTYNTLSNQIFDKYNLLIENSTDVFEEKYSYLKYIETEKEYLESKRCLKSGDYWRLKFKNAGAFENSIIKKETGRSLKAKRLQNNFNSGIQNKISSIAEINTISFPSFFLTCLVITLKVISGGSKHLLGTASHNRLGSKEKEAVGMFVNILPLYFDIKQNVSFRELISMVDSEMGSLMRHQRYPLSLITNDPELRDISIAKNIEIIYTYQNPTLPFEYTSHFSNNNSHPIAFRPIRIGNENRFHIEIDYQVDCFKKEEIENISNVYQKVIELLDNDIDKPVDFDTFKVDKSEVESSFKLPFVTKDHNLDQTLHGIFEDKALEYPDNIAITFEDLSLTYKELNRRANILAEILLEHGAGNETPVTLVLDRSKEMMIAILAVLKSGSCYLPLSTEQPIKRTKKVIELSGSTIVLCNSSNCENLEDCITKIDLRTIDYGTLDVSNLDIDVKPENLAYIIYTSGSTGEPKGVMIEHKSVINRLLWMQEEYPLYEHDVVMQKTPYTFDVSVWELFGWYLKGSRLHFLTPGAEKEPITIIETIYKQKVTIIHFVPSMLTLFLEYLDGFGSLDRIKTIRRVSCSGEALKPEHVSQFRKIISGGINSELFNLYGPTEATVEVSLFDCLTNKHSFVPIGKPIDNVELYILDEKGDVLPPGLSGELYIGGVCLARGYFNKLDLTSEKFKYHDGLKTRLYSTGDLATYLDDGNIKYLGRIDNQVKIRGNRVELGEIENCLLSLENITEVVVISPSDENGNSYLGAYYISEDQISHSDLRNHIQRELPSYMIPSFFIEMNEFPLSSSGKLDRKALPEPESRRDKSKAFHAPINDREEELCEIWEDELKIDGVGRDDNFFDLGGDSLSLIKVHFVLEKKYSISLQDLFEYQTIESLAQHIHTRVQEKVVFDDVAYSNIFKQNLESEKIRNYFIGLSSPPTISTVFYSKLLITGATGFLGAFLVKDYLENSDSHLYLLVRGNSLIEAEDRLRNKLNYYFSEDFYDKYKDRVCVVLGDVSKNKLGMEDYIYKELITTIEAVVHAAANVRHYADREDINKINVTGTQHVINFCKEVSLKKIFFVSTLSVGLNSVKPGWTFNFIESDVSICDAKGNVYIDSKILAENLVLDVIPEIGGQIFRVGNIVSDSEKGVFQENREDNAFYNIMKEYKRRNLAPNVEVPFIDLSFVNETARAIRLLTTTHENGAFHLYNPNLITIGDMFYKNETKITSFKNYVSNIIYGDSVLTHGYYLQDVNMLGFTPYCDKTTILLNKLGFSWTTIGNIEVDMLWDSWKNGNIIDSLQPALY